MCIALCNHATIQSRPSWATREVKGLGLQWRYIKSGLSSRIKKNQTNPMESNVQYSRKQVHRKSRGQKQKTIEKVLTDATGWNNQK